MDGQRAKSGGGSALPSDLPDDSDLEPEEARGEESLTADVEALLADAKTYVEAEIAFQKSRASFTANRLKFVAFYGAAALGFLHLALIALTVGLVIALATLVGPWIATALVVTGLLLGTLVFVMKLRGKLGDIRDVFGDDGA